LKREKLFELKASGMEFDERIEELEKMEYPKPHRDFIYNTFNAFSGKHPWVGQENIYPKSIARDMYETFQSFAEYIKSYNLERVEGLLLRYLSNVYRVLVQTVPFDLKNDALDEVIEYFAVILKTTDSSLIDEWEKLRNPAWVKPEQVAGSPGAVLSHLEQEKIFAVSLKNAVFALLRSLARGDWGAAAEQVLAPEGAPSWAGHRLQTALAPYFEDHPDILADAQSRSPQFLRQTPGEAPLQLNVELTLTDSLAHNDWLMQMSVDKSRKIVAGEPFLVLHGFNAI
jgi:hypothetical protein